MSASTWTASLAFMSTYPVRERLLTPRFVGLAVADLAYFTAAGITLVALPHLVTGPLGADATGAGVAFGAYTITAMALYPVAGRLADRIGRRPLLLAGTLLCAVCMLATSQAATLGQVVLIRLLFGAAEAVFFVASLAAVADLAPPSRMGAAISYNSLGLYVGIAGGPLVGEALLRAGGLGAAWHGAAVLGARAAITVTWLGETRVPVPSDDTPAKLIHRPAVPAALGFLASTVAMGAFLAMVVLRSSEVGLLRTGLPLTVYGVVVVACRIGFVRIHDRFSPLPIGAGALGAIAVGLVMIAVGASPTGLVVGSAMLAVGVALATPAFFAAIFATAGQAQRGAAAGTASISIDLGIGCGPIVAGVIADSVGMSAAFVAVAAVAVSGAAWTLRLSDVRPTMRRRSPAPAWRPR